MGRFALKAGLQWSVPVSADLPAAQSVELSMADVCNGLPQMPVWQYVPAVNSARHVLYSMYRQVWADGSACREGHLQAHLLKLKR